MLRRACRTVSERGVGCAEVGAAASHLLNGSRSTESRARLRIQVHPALHNENLSPSVGGDQIALSGVHAKVRRAGYFA